MTATGHLPVKLDRQLPVNSSGSLRILTGRYVSLVVIGGYSRSRLDRLMTGWSLRTSSRLLTGQPVTRRGAGRLRPPRWYASSSAEAGR